MLQGEVLRDLRSFTISIKERMARKRPTDLVPFAVLYRGEQRVARITLGNLVEANLDTLAVAANLFDADQMAFVSEGYAASGEHASRNPVTGQDWERGEMAELVAKHDALGKGWIVESVTVFVINRADDLASVSLPFRYVGGKYLSWQDAPDWNTMNLQADGRDIQMDGLVPMMLRRIMAASSAGSIQDKLPAAIPTERTQLDQFTADLLSRQPRVMVELFV